MPELSQATARSGLYSVLAVNRTARWQGLIMPLDDLKIGSTYTVSVWVRLAEEALASHAKLKIRLLADSGTESILLDEAPLSADRWINLRGSYLHAAGHDSVQVDAVITADSATASFYVDDMMLIEEH